MKAEKVEIKVLFPYNPDLVKKIKSIPNQRWAPEGKYYLELNERGASDEQGI